MFGWIPNCRCCKCGGIGELEVHVICNCSLVYREEVVRLDQTVTNIFFGDVEISLVVIPLGVTRLKKTGFVYLVVAFLGGKGEKGWFDLVCFGVLR